MSLVINLVIAFLLPVFTLMSLNVLFKTDLPLSFGTWASAFWLQILAIYVIQLGIDLGVKKFFKENMHVVQAEDLTEEEFEEMMRQLKEQEKEGE